MTPTQLAANFPADHAAALLVLRQGCSLGTAKKTIRECLKALERPVRERLKDGALKVACEAAGAKYVLRPVSDANTPEQALRDLANSSNLRREESVELPGPIPPALRCDRPAFPGQAKASGKAL